MTQCPWEEIDAFRSLSEFKAFQLWMAEQVEARLAQETPVGRGYLDGNTFREKWFRHLASGEVWRLVWPESPFRGTFEKIE